MSLDCAYSRPLKYRSTAGKFGNRGMYGLRGCGIAIALAIPNGGWAQLRRFIPGQVPATGSATTLAPVRALRLRVSPVDRAVIEADRVGEVLAVT